MLSGRLAVWRSDGAVVIGESHRVGWFYLVLGFKG
jgi:hypothetical protein